MTVGKMTLAICASMVWMASTAGGAGLPTNVRAWSVEASVEASRSSKLPSGESEQISYKASGSGLLENNQPEGMRFMWPAPDLMAMQNPQGMQESMMRWKTKVDFNYQANYPHYSASEPGGTVTCAVSGEFPSIASLAMMPGQPAMVGLNPTMPPSIPCKRSSDLLPDSPGNLDGRPFLLTCEEQKMVPAGSAQIAGNTTCEREGVTITERWVFTPVR
ncbi:MAG: hypothetical protein G8345_02905 [Magnetococcales bacterium]|nr:hypothetical protein [Magnetococcales bacterium]NGZ25822.1 hypothetical protein [Magnetococcales bacterium]